jgi:hypothetical protein
MHYKMFNSRYNNSLENDLLKEDIDRTGKGILVLWDSNTAIDIFNNRMTPAKFKEYYADLQTHEKKLLLSG